MYFVPWGMVWVLFARVCLLVCLSEPSGEFWGKKCDDEKYAD